MAINISTENVMTLSKATNHVPRRRAGKKPATSTLYRWANIGIRGVKLEVISVGGSLCTSVESLQRFFDRLTEARASTADKTDGGCLEERGPADFADAAEVEKELEDLGIR